MRRKEEVSELLVWRQFVLWTFLHQTKNLAGRRLVKARFSPLERKASSIRVTLNPVYSPVATGC